ncbi:Fic family protein [Enterococcus sp. AZ196]|uniref:Fic family protein n=1 Tax=Enterococcus sp. AZ196 TaxID=2774659 RepID=UPI003D2D282D
MLEDKYSMPKDENIFLAKKTLVENIYSQAKMENINITFPDTKTIIDGMSVSGLKTDDVQKVLNLRNAWRFVLDDVSADLNTEYVKTVHAMVSYGSLAQSVPHMSINTDVSSLIYEKPTCSTEKALNYFLVACSSKLFWENNILTATILANKIMIDSGVGIFIIVEKHLLRFKKLIIDFYVTEDSTIIKQFLYDHCIFGIDYTE